MGKVIQYTRSGRVSRVLGSPVRIFYSLLFICTLEVLLWSVCVFQCSVGWSGAAQAYYIRETVCLLAATINARPDLCSCQVNLSSTTGQTVQVPAPSVDFRCLNLALKEETAWQQSFFASLSSVPLYLSLLHFDPSSAKSYTVCSCAQLSSERSVEGIEHFLF